MELLLLLVFLFCGAFVTHLQLNALNKDIKGIIMDAYLNKRMLAISRLMGNNNELRQVLNLN